MTLSVELQREFLVELLEAERRTRVAAELGAVASLQHRAFRGTVVNTPVAEHFVAPGKG